MASRGSNGAATDRGFLRRAVALAPLGRLRVEPNPQVGCLVVRDGIEVGHGWHRAYGGPHAEVEALRRAGARARGATVYLSLEPCSTQGKTPPCTEALVRAGVARVVWAASDPDPRHRGRAGTLLRQGGIRAQGPLAVEGAREVLEPFRAALRAQRPWTIAKWAMSLDGRVSVARGRGGRLSGRAAERWTHEMRGRVEAVAVGVETVRVDDPRLTCRLSGGPPEGRPQPLRVVFDSGLRTPPRSALVRSASAKAPVLLLCTFAPARRAAHLRRPGLLVEAVPGRGGRVDVRRALRRLHDLGVRRLLLEGGPTLHGAFLRAGLVDQVATIVCPLLLGGDAPAALSGTGVRSLAGAPRLSHVQLTHVLPDLLVEGYVD